MGLLGLEIYHNRGAIAWSHTAQAHTCTMQQAIPGAPVLGPQAHTSVTHIRVTTVLLMGRDYQGALSDY